jgi:hypothetical protein
MPKTIELTDEQYATITRAAQERGQSPAMLVAEVAEELRDPLYTPRYFETDEWFRHLGATDEQIAEAYRIARSRRGTTVAHT